VWVGGTGSVASTAAIGRPFKSFFIVVGFYLQKRYFAQESARKVFGPGTGSLALDGDGAKDRAWITEHARIRPALAAAEGSRGEARAVV